MKTKTNQRRSSTDDELFQIFGDIILDNMLLEEAVYDAKRAFTFIKQDALYRNNNFLDMEDE